MQSHKPNPITHKVKEHTEKPPLLSISWPVMTFYERFEHIMVLILSFIISIVVVFALLQLIKEVYTLLILETLHPLNHKVFQSIFGMIMTLLIAMEFKHSILKVLDRASHIVHTKTVILIVLLALTRKFIVLDMEYIEPYKLLALGFSVFLLCAGYWLLSADNE